MQKLDLIVELIKVGENKYEIADVDKKDEEIFDSKELLDADSIIKQLKKSKEFPFLFEAEDSKY